MPTKNPVSWGLAYALRLLLEVVEFGILGWRTCLSGETEFPSFSVLR